MARPIVPSTAYRERLLIGLATSTLPHQPPIAAIRLRLLRSAFLHRVPVGGDVFRC